MLFDRTVVYSSILKKAGISYFTLFQGHLFLCAIPINKITEGKQFSTWFCQVSFGLFY